MASLNSQLVTVTADLEQTEKELNTMREDFEKYKVRATSVLRKHQSAPVSQAEAEAKQRADELQTLVDTLRSKLDDTALVFVIYKPIMFRINYICVYYIYTIYV